eukprot:Lithocolla_globosa_v1_NODE_8451_length_820_cov_2.539869.p2 type:complete len:165 gc:universal NODE_8451_length_820_cov_2.539869:578-84(-)
MNNHQQEVGSKRQPLPKQDSYQHLSVLLAQVSREQLDRESFCNFFDFRQIARLNGRVDRPDIIKHKLHKHRLGPWFCMFATDNALVLGVQTVVTPKCPLQHTLAQPQLACIKFRKLFNAEPPPVVGRAKQHVAFIRREIDVFVIFIIQVQTPFREVHICKRVSL